MTQPAITLYGLVALLLITFAAAAVVSFVATHRKSARLERRAGDLALLAFLSSLPVVVAAATERIIVLAFGLPIAMILYAAALASGPRCRKCGERLNFLTNRQFRVPYCLFCGALES